MQLFCTFIKLKKSMERRKFFTRLGLGALATCAAAPVMSNNMKAMESKSASPLKKGEIQHMVIFDFKTI